MARLDLNRTNEGVKVLLILYILCCALTEGRRIKWGSLIP
jgi:hypothetical protein